MIVRTFLTSCVALLAACAAQQTTPPSNARSAEPPSSTEIVASGKRDTTGAVSSPPAESRPQAEPKPEPEAKAKPAPEPKRETKPEPKRETKPEPKPTPKPAPTAVAKQSAQPQPKPPSTAPAPAPAPVAAKQAAPLDLNSLEERLKETDAIGLLTKLSLKNQVDDLVGEFRAYHRGVRPPTLTQLRPAFELLLMKVLSLLQDKDPALAHDVGASREAIWAVLSDPRKLAEFS